MSTKIKRNSTTSTKDIFVKDKYIASVGNPELYSFLQNAKRILTRKPPHKRIAERAYLLLDLDYLAKEGKITERERRIGSLILYAIADAVDDYYK